LLDLAAKPTALFIKRLVFSIWPLGASSAVWCLFFFGLFCLFATLFFMVKVLRSFVLERLELFFDKYIFRTAFLAFIVGLILTVSVQSSSVTTSLVVPLVGAGVLTVEQIFPYTLGANIGTTITAILAGLATVSGGTTAGLTLALAHLVFNICGAAIFYPLRFIPISLARALGNIAANNRRYAIIYLAFIFFIIPGILVVLSRHF
jgi:sodium-dependent phosphate cotransporter